MDEVRMQENWEHFPHSADMGIRGYGKSIESAFEQIALALTATTCDPVVIQPKIPVQIKCQTPDQELLLVDWLNALIYEMATRKMLFSRFEVNITDFELKATAWGEAVNRKKHQPAVEVKGATYTELKVAQLNSDQWITQCIIDV